jgi:MFS family permease
LVSGEFIGVLISIAVFTGVTSLTTEDQFLSWGWRIPFLLSVVVALVAHYVRRMMSDSPEFEKVRDAGTVESSPLMGVVRKSPRQIIVTVGLRSFENSIGFLIPVFMLNYAVSHGGVSESVATTGVMVGTALAIAALPFFGWLSDHVGRRNVFLFGTVFIAAFVYPTFQMLDGGSTGVVILAFALNFVLGTSPLIGAEIPWVAEFFPANLRMSGVSLGLQVGALVGGGVAPFLATLLMGPEGAVTPVVVYVLVLAAIGAVSALSAEETAKKELIPATEPIT